MISLENRRWLDKFIDTTNLTDNDVQKLANRNRYSSKDRKGDVFNEFRRK